MIGDCTLCGGAVEPDGDRETCTRCGHSPRPIQPKPDRAGIARAVAQVKATRPLLCPSCLGRRCRNCHVTTCECPGNHPRRTRVAS